MKPLSRKIWNLTAGFVVGVVILLAIIVGMFRLAVDHVPEYKQQIERLASEATGMQVTLDTIDARMRFLGPELFFTGATVSQDGGDAPLLHAQQGRISMDLIETIRSRRLTPGRVILTGASVEIVRDADGRLSLAGYTPPASVNDAETERFDASKLPDGAFELRNSTLVIDDTRSGGRRWTLTGLRIALDHRGDSLEIAGSANLPESLGSKILFEADLYGPIGETDELDGRFYADVRDVVFSGWREAFPRIAKLPASGDGDLAIWLFLTDGQLSQVHARADLNHVQLNDDTSFEYQKFTGRAEWEKKVSGWNGRISNLQIESNDHSWPETQINLEFTQGAADADIVVYADANYLRLDDLVPLADLLPDSQFKTDLNRFAPEGDVTDFLLQYSGAPDQQASFNVQADLARLSINPGDRTPGFRNLSATLRASQSGGQLQVNTGESLIHLPWLFVDAIPLQSVDGTIVWRDSGNAIRVISDRLLVSTIDGDADLNFDLNVPGDGAPAQIELQGLATDMQLSGRVEPYLPSRIMSPGVVGWLNNAFRGGYISQAQIQLSGPLNKFPFRNDEGLFRIEFSIENSTLNYADNWPLVTDFWANVVFENEGLTITGNRASTAGTRADTLVATFADFANGVLKISADITGGLDQIHNFVLESPLINSVGDVVVDMILDGEGIVELDLTIPVRNLEETDVHFSLHLADATLGLQGLPYRFDDLNGTIHFNNTILDAQGITGTLFGQPIVASISPHPDTAIPDNDTLVIIHGVAEAESLVDGLGLPLKGRLRGKTDWRADVRLIRKRDVQPDPFEILFRSRLTGMGIDLPAPLGKEANESIDVAARYQLTGDTASVDIEYGGKSNAMIFVKRDDPGWRLNSGSVMLGGMDALPSHARGLVVAGRMDEFVLEDWLSLIPEERGDFRLQDVLHSVEVDVEEARALGYRFAGLRLEMKQEANAWAVNLQSDLAHGAITFPFDLRGGEPLRLAMDKLYLTDSIDEQGGNPDPRLVPYMDINIGDFDMADRQLGSLSARVIPDETGIDITDIVTKSDSLLIGGSGRWEVTDSGQRSVFSFECESTDFGATLASLGIPDGLTGDNAYASVDVWWPGPPDGHFLEKIGGTVSFNIKDGYLTEVDPGAGRLFGLLSVSALPRRLSLDFSDVFQKGLAFDSLGGDFQLYDGDAFTDSLALSGPAAKILIVGRTGIAKRDYDQIAVVSTNIGRSLVLPGAFAAGPGVGAAVWLFSEIFKDPLTDISRVSYQITGSWDDPKIERVAAEDQELAQGDAQ